MTKTDVGLDGAHFELVSLNINNFCSFADNCTFTEIQLLHPWRRCFWMFIQAVRSVAQNYMKIGPGIYISKHL